MEPRTGAWQTCGGSAVRWADVMELYDAEEAQLPPTPAAPQLPPVRLPRPFIAQPVPHTVDAPVPVGQPAEPLLPAPAAATKRRMRPWRRTAPLPQIGGGATEIQHASDEAAAVMTEEVDAAKAHETADVMEVMDAEEPRLLATPPASRLPPVLPQRLINTPLTHRTVDATADGCQAEALLPPAPATASMRRTRPARLIAPLLEPADGSTAIQTEMEAIGVTTETMDAIQSHEIRWRILIGSKAFVPVVIENAEWWQEAATERRVASIAIIRDICVWLPALQNSASWFHALEILDAMYVMRMALDSPARLTSCVIARLVLKVYKRSYKRDMERLRAMQDWPSRADMDTLESSVLLWLGWDTAPPTVGTWLAIFWGRMSAARSGRIAHAASFMRRTAVKLAAAYFTAFTPTRLLATGCQVPTRLSPRDAATGLWCLAADRAGLLPVGLVLGTPAADNIEWVTMTEAQGARDLWIRVADDLRAIGAIPPPVITAASVQTAELPFQDPATTVFQI